MEARAKRVENQIKKNRNTGVTWLVLAIISVVGWFTVAQFQLPTFFNVIPLAVFVGSTFWFIHRMKSLTAEDLVVLDLSRALSALEEHKQDPSEDHLKEFSKQLRKASNELNNTSTSSLRRQLRKKLREVAASLKKIADAEDASILNANASYLRELARHLMNPKLDDLDSLDKFVSRMRQLHEKQGVNLATLIQRIMGSIIGQIVLSFIAGVFLFPLLTVVALSLIGQDPILFLHNNPPILLTGVSGIFGVFVVYFAAKGRQ